MSDIDLTSSTENLVVLKQKLKETGQSQQAIIAALYNLTRVAYAICNNLDYIQVRFMKAGSPVYKDQ